MKCESTMYYNGNENEKPLKKPPIGKGDLEICMAHFGEQNGDLMSDPAMTFVYTLECGGSAQLIPYSYRNDYVGVFDTAKTYRAIVGRRVFANTWGRNIIAQGFRADQNVEANTADKVTA